MKSFYRNCKTIICTNTLFILSQKKETILSGFPSVYDKLEELYYLEDNLWYHQLDVPVKFPESLDFARFVTRSNVRSLKDIGYSTGGVSQKLIDEVVHCVNHFIMATPNSIDSPEYLSNLLDCIFRRLSKEKSSILHKLPTQIDRGAKVETFLKRSGYDKIAEVVSDDDTLPENLWKEASEIDLDSDKLIRFKLRSKLMWQLRSANPLPPVSQS